MINYWKNTMKFRIKSAILSGKNLVVIYYKIKEIWEIKSNHTKEKQTQISITTKCQKKTLNSFVCRWF